MNQTQTNQPPIKVYYDGQCGLCRREIDYYKKIQPDDVFEWIDLGQFPTALEADGISYASALMHLHVKDINGQFQIGLDGFITIWHGLGGKWVWLAKWVRVPGLHFMGHWLYQLFAKWRFKRLSHCQLATKQNTR